MGFPYFLVIIDINGPSPRHPGGTRGELGRRIHGGLRLGITELNPLRHGLIFERFTRPRAHLMPDIDASSFDERRIGEGHQYVREVA